MLLEGRVNSFTLETEKRFIDQLEKFKHDQMDIEQNQRVEKKKYETQVDEQLSILKDDLKRYDGETKIELGELKKWTEKTLKEVQLTNLSAMQKKLDENEVALKKAILTGGGSAGSDQEMKAMKDQKFLEYVDTMLSAAKSDL